MGTSFLMAQPFRKIQSSKSTSSMNTMNQQNTDGSSYSESASQIREGIYVNEGQTLF